MYDLEEQEQIDALKQFWKENGRLIIAVALAFVLGVAAIQGWKHYNRTQSQAASALFAKLEEAQRKNDLTEIRNVGQQLTDRYGRTAYGAMSALILAKVNYDAGDKKAAAAQLLWVVEHAKDPDTAALARLRLAGIRLDEKSYDDALKLLDAPVGEAFVALYADLRGDVLQAQGKSADARAAYQKALEKVGANNPWRNLVQAKLDALGQAQ
jgi:predicted negative regulator of RcsB-dependent stress response